MTGIWERRVLPHIIGYCCCMPPVMKRRAEVLPLAVGKVLELGIGAGANLQFYDAAKVVSVTGIEPSAELRAMALAAPRPDGVAVDVVDGVGEALPFPERSFDTVVCTFTLCSVQSPEAVISEARRVLKPGGQMLFCEHGLSPDPAVTRWQGRIEPIWKRLMGNCHLTRAVTRTIEDNGFHVRSLGKAYAPRTPRWAGWMEWGVATRD